MCEATALRARPNFFGVLTHPAYGEGIGPLDVTRDFCQPSGKKKLQGVSGDLLSSFQPCVKPLLEKLQFTL
jgi:hypothetical protein